jgi:hypothetical protein
MGQDIVDEDLSLFRQTDIPFSRLFKGTLEECNRGLQERRRKELCRAFIEPR